MHVTDEREEEQTQGEEFAFPASYAQRRLWFLDQMEPGSPAYNIPAVLRLSGRLDADALARSLEEVVRRHELLRTTFALEGDEPVQVIAPALEVPTTLVELSALKDEAARASKVRTLAYEESRRPFDLSRGPLLRVTLMKLSEEEHVLLLTMHHIVSDGWSIGVLFRELSALYGAFSEGVQSPLTELPIQYADYAEWQRGWLAGGALEGQLSYWHERLAGAPALLELPSDRPRPAVQSFDGAKHSARIPAELARRVGALSRREGATLYMTMLAAFEALLSRYTGQKDLVVGMPVAGRTREELEGLIGFFVNTLALRADLSGDPTFSELVGRVREACLGAYANQDVPFEKLVEELQPERSLSHNPIYQVVFTYTDAPAEGLSLPGLKASVDEGLGNGSSKFDLNLIVIPERSGDEGVRIVWEYNTDLFDAATIERMAGHYATLLETAASNPLRRISELPLLTEDERRQLLFEFGGGNAEYACDETLHATFEAQAARTPEATAVVFEGRSLSYSELDASANKLAHHLRTHGVAPGVLVGVCVERSLELVVALLGTLKAGGAYVPLDPAYPKDRVAFMLEDSKAAVLLTQRDLLSTLPEHPRTVCLGDETTDGARQHKTDEEISATADDLAYVIYTSGSTGRPKGVQVTHRNVARLFEATRGWFDFDERDTWTLFHSYAFDFSVWELWGALLYGGRLVVVPWEVSRNPEAFYKLLSTERVTVLNQTPSAFRQLVRAEDEAGTAVDLSLRLVIFGGEALELQSLAPWFERHGDASPRLVNMYGITETTVHVTYRPITAAEAVGGAGSSPIGVPIPDLSVYLLDEYRQLVPVGVPGEIYVGGAGLARGYLNRPKLTAERFVADPFSKRAGAQLYKSGDLARRLPDGSLEYIGRADRQVKIRGFRIELGEIEAALVRHASVSEALVVASEDAGDARLVAYVVACGEVPTAAELRGHLKERLPEYMVPSAFIVLDAMPLTVNGKIDQRALPAPDQSRPDLDSGYAAPSTLVEAKLASMWEELLGVERVGVNDDFFDLGGHSILATILVSSVRKQFHLDLPLRTLFEASTVAELASVIERTKAGKGAAAKPAIVPVSRESHRVKASAE